MIIDCEENPSDLIEQIGDPNFWICKERPWNPPNFPRTLRITDCENSLTIDVTGESTQDTWHVATYLCRLLNQDYKKVYNHDS